MDQQPGRRAFMAGAAGLAAGAALLGTGSPAGAATTDDDVVPLWIDEGTSAVSPIDLGLDGRAHAWWVAEGDLCAMTLRIEVGEEADLGSGTWLLDGTTFPVGYRPLIDPPDPTVLYQWLGSGFVIDPGQSGTQACHALIPMWADFTGAVSAATMIWLAPGLPGAGGRLGDGGTAPFQVAPGSGSVVCSSTTYRRVVPEE